MYFCAVLEYFLEIAYYVSFILYIFLNLAVINIEKKLNIDDVMTTSLPVQNICFVQQMFNFQ